MEEVVINEDNFSEYFMDVRHHRPQPGQVMAKFTAVAELIDHEDHLKRDIVNLLVNHESGAKSALKILQKVVGAREADAIVLLRTMATDLMTKTMEEVLDTPYSMVIEHFYYTMRECVPNSAHWETIPLIDPSKWTGFETALASMQEGEEL